MSVRSGSLSAKQAEEGMRMGRRGKHLKPDAARGEIQAKRSLTAASRFAGATIRAAHAKHRVKREAI
jgi:hypothetical protein